MGLFQMTIYLPIAGTEVLIWQLVLIGLTVGVIGGFFGVGGAFMVTPALNVFGFPMAYAIGTDMAHIAGKSIVATVKHRKLGNVDIKLGVIMIIFTAIGIELGASLVMWLESIGRVGMTVRIVYITLLFGLGTYMLVEYLGYSRKAKRGHAVSDAETAKMAARLQKIKLWPMIRLKTSGVLISLWVIGAVGAVTGFLAGFMGVGGGFVRMPALIYLIGCPTTVAVGTDLFEVMFSGAYGAFTYALKGKVEIMAAVIMLLGAAVGAQFGTVATKYVKGLVIRFYFSLTMILAGVSVIFKQVSANYKSVYEGALHVWVKETTALSTTLEIKEWIVTNKPAVHAWAAQQTEAFQAAYALSKTWNHYAGYLMIGVATTLSVIIIAKMTRGIMYERSLHKKNALEKK